MNAAQARAYVAKAEEYLAAAVDEFEADRAVASTSLAIHAGINAADAVTGMRLGQRAAGQDHDDAIALLRTAGPDGVAVAKELGRLLPMKTRAEYEPDDIPKACCWHDRGAVVSDDPGGGFREAGSNRI